MSSSTSANNITHAPYRQQQQQHPVNSNNNSINIVCPEQRKGLLKTGLALAGLLVVANVSLLLALVQQRDNGGVAILGDGSRAMTTTEASFTASNPSQQSSLLPRRLPPDFRYPQRPEECPASLAPLTSYAPASMDSKVSYPNQKQFVMGGYQQIDKGSGDYKLVGPIVSFLSQIQHSSQIFGTVAEVGVHHGRFTGALFVTARSTEKLVAADLFEDLQYQNIDTSGYGNRQAFDRGLQSYGLDPEKDVHLIYTGSTTDLPLDWHLSKKSSGDADESFEPFRMISVDAGHTDALTFNDLELAFCNALKGGIIILDDVSLVIVFSPECTKSLSCSPLRFFIVLPQSMARGDGRIFSICRHGTHWQ